MSAGPPGFEQIRTLPGGHGQQERELTLRTAAGVRRFTRLTNAHSKKVENHAAMVALHFMHYNFCRIHETIRVTPAMAAGLAKHVWELEELVSLLD